MSKGMRARVGPVRATDGGLVLPRAGNAGELIVGDAGARYAEQSIRGNSFVWSTVTAASIPALGNNAPSLWNPAGSGVITVVTAISLQAAAVGTPVCTGLQLGYLEDAGAQKGTGAPVLTATFIEGLSTVIGSRRKPKTLFAGYAITFTSPPSLLCALGLNMGATATETPYEQWVDLDGRVALYPGGLVQLAASTATSKTFNVSFFGYEQALPLLAQ